MGKWANTLFTQDNLYILNGMNSESVDLIYLDPPFNSKRMYSAPVGSKAAGASFKDMWTWQDVDESYMEALINDHPHLVGYIKSVGVTHGKSMMSYVTYLAQRIIQLHRVLKSTGGLYLHCDPTASHYIKILLDGVFGKGGFRNEIIWGYKSGGVSKKWFGRKHDVILYYAKAAKNTFKVLKERSYNRDNKPYRFKGVDEWQDKEGKWYTLASMRDVWEINPVGRTSKERTGYPTQKPLALLHRIVEASSREGEIVLDPFCGCGTACVAAAGLNRRYIGIDIETAARGILIERLKGGISLENADHGFVHRTDIPQRTDIKREPPTLSVKERLYRQQKKRCNGCRHEYQVKDLEIDHIIPKSKGGGDYYANYQLLCGHCNRMKGDRRMEYLNAKIRERESEERRISFG